MMVKAAPLFATILCRWLGRLAMPIGEALSAAVGAIVKVASECKPGETGLLDGKELKMPIRVLRSPQ